MKQLFLASLVLGLVVILPGPILGGADPVTGDHETTGPVKILWEARYRGSPHHTGQASAVSSSPDGATVYVTGFSGGTGTFADYVTIAYDAETGEEIWITRYDGKVSGGDVANDLVVSPDGSSLYVTGSVEQWGQTFSFGTVKYDAPTGTPIWDTFHLVPWSDRLVAESIATTPDGSIVIVVGYAFTPMAKYDILTVAYDAVKGTRLWSGRHPGYPAHSVAVGPGGDTVYVTGHFNNTGTAADYVTLAYDVASGEPIWQRRYDGTVSGNDFARRVTVSPDGSTVYVSGCSDGLGTLADWLTIAYDAGTGTELWDRRYIRPGVDDALGLGVSPDGSRLFATGFSHGSDSDAATLAYDTATGEELWSSRYDGPSSYGDVAHSLVVNPDGGTVYVTGSSSGIGTSHDYITLAYDAATGEQTWSARYDGSTSGMDLAREIAVTHNGSKVVVTGFSSGMSRSYDYVTVAYAPVYKVDIDVAPVHNENLVMACGRGGTVTVAILGGEDLDVRTVDPETLRLGPGEAACAHDLSVPFVLRRHLRDVNGDSHLDLITHYVIGAIGIVDGPQDLVLSGRLDDRRFIEGTDEIIAVACY
jgi:hypothetical protein